jgi:hypothetical protein
VRVGFAASCSLQSETFGCSLRIEMPTSLAPSTSTSVRGSFCFTVVDLPVRAPRLS